MVVVVVPLTVEVVVEPDDIVVVVVGGLSFELKQKYRMSWPAPIGLGHPLSIFLYTMPPLCIFTRALVGPWGVKTNELLYP